MKNVIAKQAIVIGGSIAGLCTAQALTPYFETVIMVERDNNPNSYIPRKTVPQSHHAHLLLQGGEEALNSLFPSLTQDLIKCGSQQIDFSRDARWYHAGAWKMRYKSGFEVLVQSRPMLEQVIRRRVNQLDNIEFYFGYQVEQFKLSDDNKAVTGVVLQSMEDRFEKIMLDADLVVDASGRGSKTPQWLEKSGFTAPQETELKIDLSYSTRMYKMPENHKFDFKVMVINPLAPNILRAGYILPVENNKVLVTYAAYSGDKTPQDNESFKDYAKGLAQPDLYEAIKDLEPMTDVKCYTLSKTCRRHYEKLDDMPNRLLVLGDAVAYFNPVFGQGMSVAAISAQTLAEMLKIEQKATLATLGKRFQKEVASVIEVPWMLGSTEDFRYPNTIGEKAPIVSFMHWYSQHIYELSATDTKVFNSFAKVLHMRMGAEALFSPTIAWKVIKHAFTN